MKAAGILTVAVLLAGCSTAGPKTAPSSSSPVGLDSGYVCRALANTALLSSAQAATASDRRLADRLAAVETFAPTEMRAPFDNIIGALRGGDLSIVGPDSRLLAGECRARNLPIPTVT